VIGRARTLISQFVTRLLGWLATKSPSLAFRACDALATFWAITARRPTRKQLHALFPDLPASETQRVLRRIRVNHARNLLIGGWVRRQKLAPIRALVRPSDALLALRPSAMVGTFHIGPTLGLGVLPDRLQGGRTLVLRGAQFPLDRAVSKASVPGKSEQQRAAMFHDAVECLTDRGFVLVALDPQEATRLDVPFLGGTLRLARGPFAIARVARVPIVPVIARWEGREIELVVGDPLPPSRDENELAASAAKWLEGYLRSHPDELSYRVLELMS